MKKKSRRKKGKGKKFDIKKTLAFKSLIFLIMLLIILIILYVFVYKPVVKDKVFEGELGTLKWDVGQDFVRLDVLEYKISEDNLNLSVNVNWSSGNFSFDRLFFDFNGIGNYCNYTKQNDLNFGENKTYVINYEDTYCDEGGFENLVEIEIFAEVYILTQTTIPIPDIIVYNDDSLINVVDLDDYFNCLKNISYMSFGDITNRLGMMINNTTNKISFDPKLDRYGTFVFNLTATCEGDILNFTTSGDNMSFNVIFINENAPIPNEEPEFNDTACDNLVWEVNTNYILNMSKCWYDEDGDDLDYRYINVSGHNDNLTIRRDGEELTLDPDTNWVGTGYFRIYGDDGKDESFGRVDFRVRNTSAGGGTLPIVLNPKIKSSSPSSTNVHILRGNKSFSITAEYYDEIKWYLNGALVKSNVLNFDFSNLEEGDIIKVEVINETRVDSKTWNIKMKDGVENDDEEPLINVGNIVFYLIIIITCVIIFLIIWLFISEKNEGANKIVGGFGFSQPPNKPGPSSNYFNIPGQ